MVLMLSRARCTERSKAASPDGLVMREEMTVPSRAMVKVTLTTPSSDTTSLGSCQLLKQIVRRMSLNAAMLGPVPVATPTGPTSTLVADPERMLLAAVSKTRCAFLFASAMALAFSASALLFGLVVGDGLRTISVG